MKRFFSTLMAVSLIGCVQACDGPTLPSWDVVVRTPSIQGSFTVDSVLPPQVSRTEDAFQIPTGGWENTLRLVEICPVCATGLVIQYPAFTYSDTAAMTLGSQVTAVYLRDQEMDFKVWHNLPMNLLIDESGDPGSLELSLLNEGESGTEAIEVYSGLEWPIPPNQNALLPFSLSTGTVIGNSGNLAYTLNFPGSDNTYLVSGDEEIRFGVPEQALVIDSVDIDVVESSFAIEGREVSFPMDAETRVEILNRAQNAEIQIQVSYPFDVSGTVYVSLSSEGSVIVEETFFVEEPGQLEETVELTPLQIEQLLTAGSSSLTVRGTIQEGNVTITPSTQIDYKITLRAEVRLGDV